MGRNLPTRKFLNGSNINNSFSESIISSELRFSLDSFLRENNVAVLSSKKYMYLFQTSIPKLTGRNLQGQKK